MSIGICNSSCCVINSNGSSFLGCILCNTYFRTGFNSIILTIDFNACCSTLINNSLYLRTGSKGLLSCTIRNLNKSIVAVSTATAGNGNSTINSLIAISQQTDNCRICFAGIQSNFFNIVCKQAFFIFFDYIQIFLILANRESCHRSTRICNLSSPIAIEFISILYSHKDFIMLTIYFSCINLIATIISKYAKLTINNVHITIIYHFSIISIYLLVAIPLQFTIGVYSYKSFGRGIDQFIRF